MSCPTDQEWMEHLDGATPGRGQELEAHRAACAACSELVTAARQAMAALTNLSPGSRRLCPPPEDLLATAGGVGSLRVRLHVALCADCREDLADWAVLEEEPPAKLVARWLADGFRIVTQTLSGLAPELVPALAVRGGPSTPGWRVRQSLEDGELALELAPGDTQTFALSVTLAPKPRSGTRVDLESEGRLLESRAMDTTGVLAFLGLAPGRYRVTVRRPAGTPVVTEVEVG
jgi:hypothetical protein